LVLSGFWFHVSVGQISGLSRFLGRFCDFFFKNEQFQMLTFFKIFLTVNFYKLYLKLNMSVSDLNKFEIEQI
jgi:hypothetical protein